MSSSPTPVLALLLLAGCAATPAPPIPGVRASAPRDATPPVLQDYRGGAPRPGATPGPPWDPGQPLLQGFLGVAHQDEVQRKDGPDTVEGGSDFDSLPTIGGGGQWKLGGERVDLGLEGMLTLGGRANGGAIFLGGGGGSVAISLDLFMIDVFGGPFASVFLGDRVRLYGSLGPMLQWVTYHESGDFSNRGSDSGFGYGWYTRAGLEFRLDPDTQLGFGARWADTEVDLGGGLGDLDLEGTMFFVSVSRGI